jgi:uncharacterized membrane protein YebE (DUF533 family)
MAESQILSVIRVWAAVAWADGVLAEPEAEGLRRLIRNADLTTDERTAAMGLLEGKVLLPETYLESLTEDARHGIYRAACKMAIVDHVFTVTERKVLDKLRAVLAIADELARDIETDFPELT